MKFSVKKVENCFRNALTYEYSLPIFGSELIERLRHRGVLGRVDYVDNDYYLLELNDHTRVKGFTFERTSKVSFFKSNFDSAKADYESWLSVENI